MLIQHNPNEGLKQEWPDDLPMWQYRAHSAQPERGIETEALTLERPVPGSAHSAQPERGIETSVVSSRNCNSSVLIQHNPNEGLKQALTRWFKRDSQGAHSAQPERGIETRRNPRPGNRNTSAHSAQPERGIETAARFPTASSAPVLIQHNPNEGLKHPILQGLR